MPLGQFQSVIRFQIALPDYCAGFWMQGEGLALFAQNIHRLRRHGGRHTRPALVILGVQIRWVIMPPKRGSGAGMQAPDALLFLLITHRVNPLANHGER